MRHCAATFEAIAPVRVAMEWAVSAVMCTTMRQVIASVKTH
ncbi:protein of unknown function [Blastococcus saxobsidens DD2]|uniref:Uncharacterized protein n=1 Tax=Blastococcus saxobsidens (strain DD2) TaxID=1146883 RepID=H6RIL2_BLASD|nr:protein of unknown function [Blastococcus saxobsidens DD2]